MVPEVSIHLSNPRSLWMKFFAGFLLRMLIHSVPLPQVYNGNIDDGQPCIIDTEASVCITPHRRDFTFYHDSKVKIKDLSKSNTVKGEGFIRWKVRDTNGKIVNLDLPGYHMPAAEVRLLSPQVLLATVGQSARGTITSTDLVLCLGNEVEL